MHPTEEQLSKWYEEAIPVPDGEEAVSARQVIGELIVEVRCLRQAVNGFRWLGNNLHNIKDDPDTFRALFEAALQDAE